MFVHVDFKKYKPRFNPHEHPFLKEKEFRIVAYNNDNRVKGIKLIKNQFEILDNEITRIDFEFESFLTYRNEKYFTIEIIQSFQLQWDDNPYLDKPKFNLIPHRWFCDPEYEQGLHPLLMIDNKTGTIEIDCLVIDLTEFWKAVHQDNKYYTFHRIYWKHGEINFRILAHLAGPPLIWYVSIPSHVTEERKISPHIFYCPADFGECQPNFFDHSHAMENYGLSDMDYLKKGVDKGRFQKDGSDLIEYLVPPFPDEDILSRENEISHQTGADTRDFRNVMLLSRVTNPPSLRNKPQPMTWKSWAGLEKAFIGDDNVRPKQVLMLPQRPIPGEKKDGLGGALNKYAVSKHLQLIIKSMFKLLAGNRVLFNGAFDEQYIDKYILSCFSQSGVDLWEASMNNIDKIKAIIAIEPQNLPEIQEPIKDEKGVERIRLRIGYQVIRELLKKDIEVFLVGRNHKSHFRVPLSEPEKAKIKFLPTPERASKIFKYPPDVNASDYLKYRLSRILDPSLDPLITDNEKKIFDELKAKGKSAEEIFKIVFHDIHNRDKTQDGDVQSWYSHAFALTGGDDITLPAGNFYGKPVKYNTFFQVCVQIIG